MTVADGIIYHDHSHVKRLLLSGEEHVDDLDDYGYTPLIQTVIADDVELAKFLIEQKADLDKTDITARSPLHWAAHLSREEFCQLLLEHGADPNSHTRAGQPVLAYPFLRNQQTIKKLLYQYGADLNFAQDFINGKLIGHRFQLTGDVDIVNSKGEFIELDFEGFFLEFTVEIIRHSLVQFRNHFVARKYRHEFYKIGWVINAFHIASELIKYQHNIVEIDKYRSQINRLLDQKLLLLPVAYQGHAITFLQYGSYLAKCDRGEHSDKNGSINIYRISKKDAFNKSFIRDLIYNKHSESYFHEEINHILGLVPTFKLPISRQTAGNCSWANIEAVFPTAIFLLSLTEKMRFSAANSHQLKPFIVKIIDLFEYWRRWDQDRAINECIISFHHSDEVRKASKAAILGCVLFQSCDYRALEDLRRAEKILSILEQPEYNYVLQSYLKIYCKKRLTKQGNNLLQILDDCGIYIAKELQVRPMD